MSGNLAVSTINGVDISVSPVATQAFANSLLAEYEVTGSAVTSIDFSGLDINTHKSYRVEIELINATASTISLSCFVNGDMAITNYYTQVHQVSNAVVGASRTNTCDLLYCTSSVRSMCIANIIKVSNYVFIDALTNFNQASGVEIITRMLAKTATVTNITQLTFTSSVASAIGVGSKIRIYRGDV